MGARWRLAALALGIASLFVLVQGTGDVSAQRVRDWIEPWGLLAPLAFVAVSAALTCALFPGPLLAGASGLLFGTALGTPVSICAGTLGAVAAFSVARGVGHDAVEQLAGPRLQGLRGWVGRRGFWSVLYARLAPGVPYSLVNYAAGLAPVSLRAFAAATALGASPRAFAYTALGGSLGDLGRPEARVALAVLVLMALAGTLALRRDLRRERAAARPPAPGTGSSSPAGRSAVPR